ncbi:hypothetical protein GCM10020220_005290 [Nonomuraea rubra]
MGEFALSVLARFLQLYLEQIPDFPGARRPIDENAPPYSVDEIADPCLATGGAAGELRVAGRPGLCQEVGVCARWPTDGALRCCGALW